MMRFYGNEPDWDDPNNHPISTSGNPTNIPSMIADLPHGTSFQYIYVTGDDDFRINEIMCYQSGRLTRADLPYPTNPTELSIVKVENGYIGLANADCPKFGERRRRLNTLYYEYDTSAGGPISRVIGITRSASIEYDDWERTSRHIDSSGSTQNCAEHADEWGWDCNDV